MRATDVLGLEKFNWNKKTRTLSADASELGIPPGVCLSHVKVKSDKTGVEKTFFLMDSEETEWGSPIFWVYYDRAQNAAGRIKLVIWND